MTYETRLSDEGGVLLLRWLKAQTQFGHYQITEDAYLVFAEEIENLPITLDQAKDVCRSLMAVDDRMPTAQRIRYRALEATGILAPSWEDAVAMVRQALADQSVQGLPGPVRQAVDAKGGLWTLANSPNQEASFAQLRDTYAGVARAHDRFVLEPGGLEAFWEACQYVAAARDRDLKMLNGRWAAEMLDWDRMPADLDGALAAAAEYEARFGGAAVRGVEPPPRPTRDRREDLLAMAHDLGRRLSPAVQLGEEPARG